jgi:large-conductance mechanosensitive channel
LGIAGSTMINYGPQVSGIINVIFIMFAIGIVVGVVAEGTNSLRKMQMRTTQQMVKSLLNMVIYIVVGMASIGILYSMVL